MNNNSKKFSQYQTINTVSVVYIKRKTFFESAMGQVPNPVLKNTPCHTERPTTSS